MSENNPIPEGTKYLLLVEGSDEKQFFISLAEHVFENVPFHILEYVGADKFETTILPLPNNPNFSQLSSIGIIRDADYDIDAFKRIQSALERVNKCRVWKIS